MAVRHRVTRGAAVVADVDRLFVAVAVAVDDDGGCAVVSGDMILLLLLLQAKRVTRLLLIAHAPSSSSSFSSSSVPSPSAVVDVDDERLQGEREERKPHNLCV